MKSPILCLIIWLALCSGCAFTVSKTPLNYSYQGKSIDLSSSSKIEIAPFEDKRSVADGKIIFQKRNEYGTTSGAYEAEMPMVDIIRNSIVKTLEGAGATINATQSKVRLEGELMVNDYQVLMGFWKGKVTNTTTMKFRLTDSQTGELIWQDTISGKYTGETSWGGADFVLSLVNKSIDDLIFNLMNDKFFRQKIELGNK